MSNLDQALEDCLTRLAEGDLTLEECLTDYPDQADDLYRLLMATETLESGQQVQPSPTFKARARGRLMAHMLAPRPQPAPPWWSTIQCAFNPLLRLAFTMILTFSLCLGGGTVLAQTAQPGDALYAWKVATEQVWRTMTGYGNNPAIPVATANPQPTLSQDFDRLEQPTAPADRQTTGIISTEVDISLAQQIINLTDQQIIYRLTITNHGLAIPPSLTLLNQLSPAETLVATSDQSCIASADGVISCQPQQLASQNLYVLTVTTAIEPCFAGIITNTAYLTGPQINRHSTTTTSHISRPFPQPAQIVYVQSNGRTHHLGLVSSEGEPLNFNLHARAAAPAWSPDGSQLAFFGEEGVSELTGVYAHGNGLWIMDMVGHQGLNARQLVSQDHIKNISWSPDGTMIAFEVSPPGIIHEVRLVAAKDGQEISRFSGQQPTWSPDSQKLIIRACRGDCGLWQVDLAGQSEQQLTFDSTDSYPSWSPTGQDILFASQRAGNWEIYRLQLANQQLTRLTNRPGTDTTPIFGKCGQEYYSQTDHWGSWWTTVRNLAGQTEHKVQEGVGLSEDWGLARPAIYSK